MSDLQIELKRYVWNTSDRLRGFKNEEDSQRLILETIFMKILLDANGDKNNYIFNQGLLSENLDEVQLREIRDEYGVEKFIDSVKLLVEDNPHFLSDVFKDIYLLENKDLRSASANILRDLSDLDFKPIINNRKDMSNIFIGFIDSFLKASLAEGMSPPSIKNIITKLLEKENIETIYNPTIGIGGLVIDVAKNHKSSIIHGQELNMDVLSICKMMLIVNGMGENIRNINAGDVLSNPGNTEGDTLKKYDCIVASPPFGVRVWGYNQLTDDKFNRFHRGLPPKTAADFAFLSHIVESLNDNGVAVALVSNGILFRGGAEGIIREKFIKENIIDCVIGLPGNMLYNTALPVSLLVFRKNRRREDILFIDVKKEEKISKSITVLSEEQINRVVDCYHDFKSIEGISRVVSPKEVLENEYNLSVSRYISNFEREELDLYMINENVKELERKLDIIKEEFEKYLT
jgi:type I restriction enzyme M protein